MKVGRARGLDLPVDTVAQNVYIKTIQRRGVPQLWRRHYLNAIVNLQHTITNTAIRQICITYIIQ